MFSDLDGTLVPIKDRPTSAFLIRLAVDWHKGKAVGWLTKQMSSVSKKPLLIYLGDDNTDEDVLAAWPGEIMICVGENQKTSANYSVRDPYDVHVFLRWLLGVIGVLAVATGMRSTI